MRHKVHVVVLLYLSLGSYLISQAQDWNQVGKIVATDRESDDLFGGCVAIDGDFAIVGARAESEDDSNGNTLLSAGSAYVFKRIDGIWVEQQKIVASDRTAGDNFGWSVAIRGNLIAVGAIWESEDAMGGNTLLKAGSVYIFKLIDNDWIEIQKLVSSDRHEGDYFGYSLDLSENQIVIGAPSSDQDVSGNDPLADAGSTYIFKKSGGVWTEQQKLVSVNRDAGGLFGLDVAISDDVVVVGAPREDDQSTEFEYLEEVGRAYVYRQIDGTWQLEHQIRNTDPVTFDNFGNSVAIDGDLIAIGAWQDDQGYSFGDVLNNAGSAYIYRLLSGTWILEQKLVPVDRSENDMCGYSVDISGDLVIVGAIGDDDGSVNDNLPVQDGCAYVFKYQIGQWTQLDKIVSDDLSSNDNFGNCVAIAGDKAIIGAVNDDENSTGGNPMTDAGSAYLFHIGVMETDINDSSFRKTRSQVFISDGRLLNITLPDGVESVTIEVVDALGRKSTSIGFTSSIRSMPLALESGIYVIRLSSSFGIESHRVLIQ